MLTTWAAEPDDEHRLLTRSLMALFRFPLLPDDRLVASLKNPLFEIQARLASHDKLTNPAEVWSSLDNELRPSISYIVTLALDPWKEITGPIVRILTLRTGQAALLPRRQVAVEETLREQILYIGGTIHSKTKGPAVGIQVAIKGTGLFSSTDKEGKYTLGVLQPGEYTLVAWPEDGKPKEKQITVPPEKDGNYDLEVG
jgi:hypothetical protein